MRRFLFFSRLLSVLLFSMVMGFPMISAVQAEITATGDIRPDTPSTWNSSTYAYIGYDDPGMLSITNGSALESCYGFIGYNTGGSGTVAVDGENSNWSSSHLSVGYHGEGTLTITNGGSLISSGTDVGNSRGSSGTATVDGEGSTWSSGYLYVGNYGEGTLTITNSGSLTSSYAEIGGWSGSSGAVTVDGENSTWTNSGHLYIGRFGGDEGTLTITNGGSLISSGTASVGHSSGSSGTATVDGENSTWTNGSSLYIGNHGNGVLNILDGATVSVAGKTILGELGSLNFGDSGGTLGTSGLYFGASQLSGSGIINTSGIVSDLDILFNSTSGSTQTFSVDNVTINLTHEASNDLGVGYLGEGSLTITDGVSVASANGYLGYSSGSSGTATVDGEGSTWTNSGSLYVGRYGEGTLAITNSGKVSSGGTMIIGYGSSGTVLVDGENSTLTTGGVGVGYSTGTLAITNGGTVTNSGHAYLGYGSNSSGTATVDGQGSTWTNSRSLYVGRYGGEGTLTISNGGTVSSTHGYIGHYRNSDGTVTVDGANSSWNNSSNLYIGSSSSNGVLNILDGATVSVAGETILGELGSLTFGGSGGTLTTDSLYIGESQLSGSGTINTSGIVADLDIVFDSASGTTQPIFVDDVAINLALDASNDLGVGYLGEGSLSIINGASVASANGYLGYDYGSNGTATVDGEGSTWTNSGSLYVSRSGKGTLAITNGGKVSSGHTQIGYGSSGTVLVDGENSTLTTGGVGVGYSHSTGTLAITNGGTVTNSGRAYLGHGSNSSGMVTVNGENSTWTNSGSLDMSLSGEGKISIADGGLVTASSGSIGSSSTATVDVNSAFKVGTAEDWTGDIDNDGTVRLVAGAGADAGTYTPISYGTMSGDGSVQALGGIWDADAHTITVSDAVTAGGTGGATAELDLSVYQRVLITDINTGMSSGAGFLSTDSETEISFTANALGEENLSGLGELIADTEDSILSAWNFSATNYEEEIYLSLYADSAANILDLAIWYLVDDEWSEYDATDLAFDGIYASLTVTELGTFAVTSSTAVPIPGAVWLLATGLIGMMGLRKRRG